MDDAKPTNSDQYDVSSQQAKTHSTPIATNDIKSIVKQRVGDVTQEEIQILKEYEGIQNQKLKSEIVLTAFDESQKNERNMRKTLAYWIMGGLLFQVLVALSVVFFVGFGLMQFQDNWILKTVLMGMFPEIIAIATIVVNNLFPKPTTDNVQEVSKLLDKL